MTETSHASEQSHAAEPLPGKKRRVLHRVCIQCNNMFRVNPENYDAKQCPNCHKG